MKNPKKPFMQFSNFNKTNLDVKACKTTQIKQRVKVKKTNCNTTQIPFRQKQVLPCMIADKNESIINIKEKINPL